MLYSGTMPRLLLTLALLLAAAPAHAAGLQTFALRLHPGDDLKQGIAPKHAPVPLAKVRELVAEKYAREDWTHRR